MLTVLRLLPAAERGRWHSSRAWECKCDCGETVRLPYSHLTRGFKTSCGCTRASKLPDFRAAARKLMRVYKTGARRRHLDWQLTEDDFFRLVTSNCHYTGAQPTKSIRTKTGLFYWNGVDRVDNKKGYLLDNVVPCSEFANMAKKDMPYEEFCNWLKTVARHWKDRI